MTERSDVDTAASETPRTGSAMEDPLVLVVDDEASMQTVLRLVLRSCRLRTVEATTGAEALASAASCNPDLILLDLGLPDADGVDVTRRLRDWTVVPILVISARGDEQNKVKLLDAGANDFVTKPFAMGELLARIRVWLRQRVHSEALRGESVVEAGDLCIDLERRLVFVQGREIHLTPIEYKLFATLMRNQDRVMTYEQLLRTTWGPSHVRKTQYLRVYMAQLRQKLERDTARPKYLMTDAGVGYRLRVAGT
jgi:two-component system, OmpR family, KDP operon response regulator KdpE